MVNFRELTLRVNDQIVLGVTARFGIEEGYPGGKPELVIDDPIVGEVVLNDNCKIEIETTEGAGFKPITTHALLTLLRVKTEGL